MGMGIRCPGGKMAATGAVCASLLLVLFALPGRAGAELITPHAATPEAVTPHEVAPPPAPAGEPSPEPDAAPEYESPQPSEIVVEEGEEEGTGASPSHPSGRKGARDVPPDRWEIPRPSRADTDSPGCDYDCHTVWFSWTLREAGRMIGSAERLEAALGPGWKFDNLIFPMLLRAEALNDFKNELVDYLMEHEFEHQLEQVLDIAHPWGPAPAPATAPAGAAGTVDAADSRGGSDATPCRNGDVAAANDEVEDRGSRSNACR
jgi:hypothetical protein